MTGFSSLNLSKTATIIDSEPAVSADRQVDFAKMLDNVAIDILTEIANCYYSNGSFMEERGERAMQSIKGRMSAIRHMVASLN